MFSDTTEGITITVEPAYLAAQSSPDQEKYVWAYRVRIENRGGDTVPLPYNIEPALGG